MMRLDKLICAAGYGSRREVKQWIQSGKVTVNGNVVKESEYKVIETKDAVCLNQQPVLYKEFYYYMLNKPQNVLSATKDEVTHEKTVIDLLPQRLQNLGLFPVGRLDKDTEGFMILSNNGQFAHNTLSPKKHVSKTYYAKIYGLVNEAHVAMFQDGIVIDQTYRCKPAQLHIVATNPDAFTSEIELTITEGKFHQVKKMFLAMEKEVYYLKRISFAGIALDPQLPLGGYRELNENEMKQIEMYL